MIILIHEQAGRRIIFYPDDRHLRQYAVSCPTLISIEVWQDAASAENALRDGLVSWALSKPCGSWSCASARITLEHAMARDGNVEGR
jgi:hypothetical protein